MSASLPQLTYYLVKSARPRQWVKNLAVYAALVFSGFFFFVPASGIPYAMTVTWAFFLFCILTSSIYLINDVVDRESDAQHPFKSLRPIAAGKLPVPLALGAAAFGIIFVALGSLTLAPFFFWLCLSYFLLQLAYAKWLKNLAIFDVVTIALGFLIRIYAGSVVVNLHLSVWFLLTVISASLFLAVAKRQSELTLLSHYPDKLGATRKTLTKYSQRLLDQYTAMFATATWLTYALFTFQHQLPADPGFFGTLYTNLPKTLHTEKLLMLSLPFVIYGVMRYLQLVYQQNKGESPDKVLFSDKLLMVDAVLFTGVTMMVLYVLR